MPKTKKSVKPEHDHQLFIVAIVGIVAIFGIFAFSQSAPESVGSAIRATDTPTLGIMPTTTTVEKTCKVNGEATCTSDQEGTTNCGQTRTSACVAECKEGKWVEKEACPFGETCSGGSANPRCN